MHQTDPGGCLQPRHLGHVEVHEHDLRMERAEDLERLTGVVRHPHAVPHRRKERADSFRGICMIVDHEHGERTHVGTCDVLRTMNLARPGPGARCVRDSAVSRPNAHCSNCLSSSRGGSETKRMCSERSM